jgi:hypothetical protein
MLAAVVASAVPRHASSDAVPGLRPGWYAPVGVTLGGSLHHHVPGGFVLGAEGSIVSWGVVQQVVWAGGFADALWDFGSEEARISIGPEIGWGPFGFDVGYVAAVSDDYKHGIAGRGIFTLSLAAFYFRLGKVFDTDEPNYKEVGALIKLPIPLEGRSPLSRLAPRPERVDADAGAPASATGDAAPAATGVATEPPPSQFAEPP